MGGGGLSIAGGGEVQEDGGWGPGDACSGASIDVTGSPRLCCSVCRVSSSAAVILQQRGLRSARNLRFDLALFAVQEVFQIHHRE